MKRNKSNLIPEERSSISSYIAIRSNVPADIDSETIQKRYKDLIQVEVAFRAMKTGYLKLRPLYLRKESRIRDSSQKTGTIPSPTRSLDSGYWITVI